MKNINIAQPGRIFGGKPISCAYFPAFFMVSDVLSTSLNINQQSTKSFSYYTRSIIYMHKWHNSPPEYVMVDLKCGDGEQSSLVQGQAYFIIYGVKDYHADVLLMFMIHLKMVVVTDLDSNNHSIKKM